MKKQLMLVVLFVSLLTSCARATPETAGTSKAVYKIGDMTVEAHDTNGKRYPDLSRYCDYLKDQEKPGTQTVDCDVPLIPHMEINFGWSAKNRTILESNWSAMSWELYIDDTAINLADFEPVSGARGRNWQLDLVNPTPGKHTLRVLWKSDIAIDDGNVNHPAGVYEYVANFTVAEK
jgi:hypothetical protein